MVWKATQKFVTVGESRGNQTAVLHGVQAGDTIVTSGQLKLKNGSVVVINNKIPIPDDPNPQLQNDE